MVDQVDNVAHVAPTTIGGLLAQLGARAVVEFPDMLTHGPVTTDPKRHRKARLSYWRGLYESVVTGEEVSEIYQAMEVLDEGYLSAEQIGSAARHAGGGGRIVVWTTPTLEDRLFLWFVFHALLDEGVSAEQIATAEPRVPLAESEGEVVQYASLRSMVVNELATGFEELFYPKLVYIEAGANLWETFASASPRQFAISIPHTTKFFPQLAVFSEDYGRLFPVAPGAEASRLELSEFDRDLLGRLDEQAARSGGEVIDDDFANKYAFLDEVVFLARLRAWSSAGEDSPYVVAKARGDTSDLFEQFEYKLTGRGCELLDGGFEAGRKLPIFFVGDSRLYAGKKPWVRVVDGDYWWFERFASTQ